MSYSATVLLLDRLTYLSHPTKLDRKELPMSEELQVVEDNGVALVTVLETECANIWPAVQPIIEGGATACILDFSSVSYLNSMSIASIISLRNKVMAANGKLALANLQDNIKSVFRILKLEKLFDLDFDGDAARAAVS